MKLTEIIRIEEKMDRKIEGFELEVEIKLVTKPLEEKHYGSTLMSFSVGYKNKDYNKLKASFLNLVSESDNTEID